LIVISGFRSRLDPQVENWPMENVGNFTMDGKTGKVIHYTQMVWGGSFRIGCGYINANNDRDPANPYRRVLILCPDDFRDIYL
jgi:hypothetical protein